MSNCVILKLNEINITNNSTFGRKLDIDFVRNVSRMACILQTYIAIQHMLEHFKFFRVISLTFYNILRIKFDMFEVFDNLNSAENQ